jgi:phosphate transport system substrate-binding protein
VKRPPRLHGGGSSFVNPMMQQWCRDYRAQKDIQIHYQSVGSGAGILHMTTGTFDFGASDAPLNEDQLKKAMDAGGEVIHVPLCLGAVVAAYNLPEIEQPVRFTPDVLADVFLGKIKKWNDPALAAINPGLELPERDMVTVHRGDASGTTYVFTEYLSKVSPEWKKQVGFGQTVPWKVGVAQKGNEGVSGHIAKTPGALGYTELTYALQHKLKMGIIRNRAGTFVRPSLESVTAAAVGALKEIPQDLRFSLTDVAGKDSYPISGTVWAVLYVNQRGDKGQALTDFLRWVTHDGQQQCESLHYARLPAELVSRLDKKLDQVKVAR